MIKQQGLQPRNSSSLANPALSQITSTKSNIFYILSTLFNIFTFTYSHPLFLYYLPSHLKITQLYYPVPDFQFQHYHIDFSYRNQDLAPHHPHPCLAPHRHTHKHTSLHLHALQRLYKLNQFSNFFIMTMETLFTADPQLPIITFFLS